MLRLPKSICNAFADFALPMFPAVRHRAGDVRCLNRTQQASNILSTMIWSKHCDGHLRCERNRQHHQVASRHPLCQRKGKPDFASYCLHSFADWPRSGSPEKSLAIYILDLRPARNNTRIAPWRHGCIFRHHLGLAVAWLAPVKLRCTPVSLIAATSNFGPGAAGNGMSAR